MRSVSGAGTPLGRACALGRRSAQGHRFGDQPARRGPRPSSVAPGSTSVSFLPQEVMLLRGSYQKDSSNTPLERETDREPSNRRLGLCYQPPMRNGESLPSVLRSPAARGRSLTRRSRRRTRMQAAVLASPGPESRFRRMHVLRSIRPGCPRDGLRRAGPNCSSRADTCEPPARPARVRRGRTSGSTSLRSATHHATTGRCQPATYVVESTLEFIFSLSLRRELVRSFARPIH